MEKNRRWLFRAELSQWQSQSTAIAANGCFVGGAEEPYQADSRRSLIALQAAFKDWRNDGDDGVAGAGEM